MPKPPAERTSPRIRVANPCPMRWESLIPVEGGRHCEACRKTVIDVERLSSAELEALVDSGERACVRIATLPDGSVLTRDHPRPPRRVGAWAGAALAASTFACAEGVVEDEHAICVDSANREVQRSAGAESVMHSERPPVESEPTTLLGRTDVVMVVGDLEPTLRGGVEPPPETPALDLTTPSSIEVGQGVETTTTLGSLAAPTPFDEASYLLDLEAELDRFRPAEFGSAGRRPGNARR